MLSDHQMNLFMLGAITMASLASGFFFLRFWRDTRDRLFLFFAISFGLEALSRTALALSEQPNEGDPLLYVIRFVAYALIVAAIIEKNMHR